MNDYKVIGAIGDSITQGFCDIDGMGWFGRFSQKAAKKFPNKYFFNNTSKGGDRICDVYHRLASQTATNETDILIVAVGINDIVRRGSKDAAIDMSEGLRIKYWEQFFDLAKKLKLKLLVLDILPIIEEERASGDKYNFNSDVRAYNDILRKLCEERKISFFERHANWEKRNINSLYVDTVHPNARAHQILADEIFEEACRINLIG